MRVLIAHRSFPGQYRWLLPELARLGIDVVFVCVEKTDWPSQGIRILVKSPRGVDGRQQNVVNLSDIGCDFAESFMLMGLELNKLGWCPDVIWAHSGWGAWRVGDIFPDAPLVLYAEWYYTKENLKYISEEELNDESSVRYQLVNSSVLSAICRADATTCPTEWQRSMFPSRHRDKIDVISDGFPVKMFTANSVHDTPSGDALSLIYVSRGLEFTRGVDRLARLWNFIKEEGLPVSLRVIADNRKVYDVNVSKETRSSIELVTKSENIAYSTQQSYSKYLKAVRSSDLHLYLSRPFVLSWSFLESSINGSRILSLDNPSTFEHSFSSHLNFPDISKICDFIALHAKNGPKKIRESKLEYLRSDEYSRFCAERDISIQIRRLLSISISLLR